MDSKKVKLNMWLNRHPILHDEDERWLETQSAIHEFGESHLPREKAEDKAYDEYRKKHSAQAAAHHLVGMRSSQGEEAKKHGLMYALHVKALGHDPTGPVPDSVRAHMESDDFKHPIKFKAHKSDAFLFHSTDQHDDGDVHKSELAKGDVIQGRFPQADPNRKVPKAGPKAEVVGIESAREEPVPGPRDRAVRVYQCSSCGQQQKITTNHEGSVYDRCPGCSWKGVQNPDGSYDGPGHRTFTFVPPTKKSEDELTDRLDTLYKAALAAEGMELLKALNNHLGMKPCFIHKGTGEIVVTPMFHDPSLLPGGDFTDEWEDGFVDKHGKYYNRRQAADALKAAHTSLDSFQIREEPQTWAPSVEKAEPQFATTNGLHNTVEGFTMALKALPKGSPARGKLITQHMNHAPFLQALGAHPQGKQLHAMLTQHLNSFANAGFKPGATVATAKSEDEIEDRLSVLYKATKLAEALDKALAIGPQFPAQQQPVVDVAAGVQEPKATVDPVYKKGHCRGCGENVVAKRQALRENGLVELLIGPDFCSTGCEDRWLADKEAKFKQFSKK